MVPESSSSLPPAPPVTRSFPAGGSCTDTSSPSTWLPPPLLPTTPRPRVQGDLATRARAKGEPDLEVVKRGKEILEIMTREAGLEVARGDTDQEVGTRGESVLGAGRGGESLEVVRGETDLEVCRGETDLEAEARTEGAARKQIKAQREVAVGTNNLKDRVVAKKVSKPMQMITLKRKGKLVVKPRRLWRK